MELKRNSTLRALRYRDIEKELKEGRTNLLIPIYPEMKKLVPTACKGGITYYTFTCEEATEAIKLYLQWREEKYVELKETNPYSAQSTTRFPNIYGDGSLLRLGSFKSWLRRQLKGLE